MSLWCLFVCGFQSLFYSHDDICLFVRYALYQGWWSLIVSLSVNNFAYFYAFHYLRVFVIPAEGDLSMHQDFLLGLIAGWNVV